MHNLLNKKIFLILGVLFISISFFYTTSRTYAVECGTCPGFDCSCQGGDMCCNEGNSGCCGCAEFCCGRQDGCTWSGGRCRPDCPSGPPCGSDCTAVGSDCTPNDSCDVDGSVCAWCDDADDDDDDDDDDDTTPSEGRAVGRVWSDLNGDGVFGGVSELWRGTDSITCADNVDPGIQILYTSSSGQPILDSWNCNPDAYYSTLNDFSYGSSPVLTLVPPAGADCADVEWHYTICRNSDCTLYDRGFGTGCTATLVNVEVGNYSNHLWWKVGVNTPPSACIAIAGGNTTIVGGNTVHVYPVGQSATLVANATDVDPNLVSMDVLRRLWDPVTGTDGGDPDYTLLFSGFCTDPASCTLGGDTVVTSGYSLYYPNAYDAAVGQCTGRLAPPEGFSECDTVGTCDEVYALGDNMPVCDNTNWPSEFTAPFQYITFPTNATDQNNNDVRYDFDASCGNFISAGQIEAYVQGISSAGDPQMIITVTDVNGVRYNSPVQTFSGFSWRSYNPPVSPIAMVELRFINDNVGRDIYVHEVRYLQSPGGTILLTLQPEQSTDPTQKVFYDIGVTVSGNTPYDGMGFSGASAYSYDNDCPHNCWDPSYSYVRMLYNGSLRMPMVWQSPATSGTGCDIAMTPEVDAPFYDGLRCLASISSTERHITGQAFERDPSAGCTAPGLTAIDGSSSSLQLYNGAATVGTADVLDSSGNFDVAGLWRSTTFDSACILNPELLGDGTKSYVLDCVQSNTAGFNCSVGPGSCIVGCTPTTQLNTSNISVNLGFTSFDNHDWFTFVDGDFYANQIYADISDSAVDDFQPYFIQDVSLGGGYGFLDGFADYGRGSGIEENGGNARELSSVGNDFTDKWLDTFTFNPPTHSEVITTLPSESGGSVTFESGKVYSTNAADFDSLYDTIATYDLSGTNGVAIIYVNGDPATNELVFDSPLASLDQGERIVIVTNLNVIVDVDFGITTPAILATLNVGSNGSTLTEGILDLLVLAEGDIEYETRYSYPTDHDYPVVVGGSFLSKTQVILARDLGYVNNNNYPAEMLRYFGPALYYLSLMDRSHEGILDYSGLSTVDVQWLYSE